MKRFYFLVLICLFSVFVSLAVSAATPASDRDHPTPLKSTEITGDLDGEESFAYFFAGPGELTITVDVKSTDGTAVLWFELLDKNAANSMINEYVQANETGASGRNIKSLKLAKKQKVVLRLKSETYGKGTYRVRLSGAVALASEG